MKAYRKLMLVALAGSVLAMLTPNARAEMLGQKIQVTFSNPVELPGTVLPQGTYIFESLNSQHMTRVLSADGSEVFGTFLTIPEDRLQTADKGIVEMGETASSNPKRVQSWFVPGKSVGNEFVYEQSAVK